MYTKISHYECEAVSQICLFYVYENIKMRFLWTIWNLVAEILLRANHERICAKAMSWNMFDYISSE